MEQKQSKVIIVDDDKFLLDMYSLKFSKSGFKVDIAESGNLLIEKLEGGAMPDIILVDVIMPGKSGIETIDEIRKKNLAQGIPIVVLSNQSQESDIKKAQDLGVAGYIVKASSIPSEVVEKIQQIIKAQ